MPYLVEVGNDGPLDIEGDVVLSPGPAPQAGTPGFANDGFSPVAVFDSRRELFPSGWAVAKRPSAPSVPQVWPVHQVRLDVPAGDRRSVTIMLIEAPYGYRAEFRGLAGELLASSQRRAAPAERSRWSVALVGSGAPDLIARHEDHPRLSKLHVTRLVSEDDFPDRAVEMSGLQAILVNDFDTATLTAGQISALQDFVGLGGSLVIGGGTSWRRTLAGLPDALVPMRPSGIATVALGPLARDGQPIVATTTVATGDPQLGRATVGAPGQPPLVLEAVYGSGRVVQLTYDPFSLAFAVDRNLGAAGLEAALAPALDPLRLGISLFSGPDGLWSAAVNQPDDEERDSIWTTWPGGGVIAAYAVAMGALVRAGRGSRRRNLIWAGPMALALVAAGAVGAVDTERPEAITRETVVEVDTLGPDGLVLVNTYHAIVGEEPLKVGRNRTLPESTAVSSILAEPARPRDPNSTKAALATAFAQPVAPVQGGFVPGGGEPTRSRVVLRSNGTSELQHGPLPPDAITTFQTLSVSRRGGSVDANVRISGDIFPTGGSVKGSDWRLSGTFTNNTSTVLRSVFVEVPDRLQTRIGRARLADEVAPGSTVTFDVPLPILSQFSPDSSASDIALLAATHLVGPRPGEAVIVALAEPDSRLAEIKVVLKVTPLLGE